VFEKRPAAPAPLSFSAALIPVAALVALLGLSFYLFGDAAAAGPNQIALVFSSIVATYIAWRHGYEIADLRDAVTASVATAISAIFILLAVGALIGTWAMSGTLLAMVYYGLELLSPHYFYLTACAICAVVAISIGSSWTVAGTIGVGLMGMAQGMGLDSAITAGAVISGAYFGDKSSPLSDTANLACAASGANLYDHIRESLWTSVPSLGVALALFFMLGSPSDFDASAMTAQIQGAFEPSLVLFVPLVLVFVLAVLHWPPFVTIFIGALAGGLLAVIVAPERVTAFADAGDLPTALALLKGVWSALATGFSSATGVASVDQLLSRGGMHSMLGTVWLILTALAFGGIVEKAGILDRLLGPIVAAAKSVGALVATLVSAAFVTNVLAADQYMAVILPARMLRREFEQRGLAPVVLSRAVGDSATVTSPLIPWNSCGAYMAATLGVATASYAPYCFLCLANPLITMIFAVLGFRMLRAAPVGRIMKAS
jgi:NhaC family Na+:H+ antiporter